MPEPGTKAVFFDGARRGRRAAHVPPATGVSDRRASIVARRYHRPCRLRSQCPTRIPARMRLVVRLGAEVLRRRARGVLALVVVLFALPARADIPATPVMTVYRFNGPLDVGFYDADDFARRGTAAARAGSLAQGTSVIPCVVVRNGRALTDAGGTPYVGFEIVVDARRAVPSDTARFKEVVAARKALRVPNHECAPGPTSVIDVRQIYALDKPPSFDPPPTKAAAPTGKSLDAIVRAFHASPECAQAHRRLMGRRAALAGAWDDFARRSRGQWPERDLARARNLDYVMRTALYEGHLDRGCNAYGACERNVIALSIRNRGLDDCRRGQGCRFPGDFEGVASSVSQYNIWDEFLTQVSGLTSCFLRPDLEGNPSYTKIRAMYGQSEPDVERTLFGSDAELTAVFPAATGAPRTALRHYYHPPAMGKCLPGYPRVEYITGAVARDGDDVALIAGTRIEVGARRGDGYLFREALVSDAAGGDVVEIVDRYPGFAVDARKVEGRPSSGCRPYGTPSGCRFERIGRYRKVPSWLDSGRPLTLTCRVQARDAACTSAPRAETVRVGGPCDVEMQPIAGVP